SNVTQSPTITTPAMTQAGVILGPAAHMSPEEGEGRRTGKRGGIWAFGGGVGEKVSAPPGFCGGEVGGTLAAGVGGGAGGDGARCRRRRRLRFVDCCGGVWSAISSRDCKRLEKRASPSTRPMKMCRARRRGCGHGPLRSDLPYAWPQWGGCAPRRATPSR